MLKNGLRGLVLLAAVCSLDLGSLAEATPSASECYVHFSEKCGDDTMTGCATAGGWNIPGTRVMPEPAALFLLGTGMLLIAGRRGKALILE